MDEFKTLWQQQPVSVDPRTIEHLLGELQTTEDQRRRRLRWLPWAMAGFLGELIGLSYFYDNQHFGTAQNVAGLCLVALGISWFVGQSWYSQLPLLAAQTALPPPLFRQVVVRQLRRRKRLLLWGTLGYLILLGDGLQLASLSALPNPLHGPLLGLLYGFLGVVGGYQIVRQYRTFQVLHEPVLARFSEPTAE